MQGFSLIRYRKLKFLSAEWKTIGTYDVFDDHLEVTLTDGVDQFYVVADAVRIERVGDVG